MSINSRSGVLTEPVSARRDHIRGTIDAPVMLLEYGDFECPFCARAYEVVKAIEAQMGNQICFAFRHFPLTSVHPNAQQAAEAAEAAGAQKQFWAMHDTLFLYQRDLRSEALIRYAKELGLNVPVFSAAMVRHTYRQNIRKDFMSGVMSGANGTPAFYINDVRHDGPWDMPVLSAALLRAAEVALYAKAPEQGRRREL